MSKLQLRRRRRRDDGAEATDEIANYRDTALSRPAVARARGKGPVTAAHKEMILDTLASGRSLAALLSEHPDMPGNIAIHAELRNDAEFAKEYEAAQEAGKEALIEEAVDYAFASRGSKILSIAASKYASVAMSAAEKLAPKRFGPLLKLAGHDGNALTVSVVSYRPTDGGKLETEEAKPLITDGSFEPIP